MEEKDVHNESQGNTADSVKNVFQNGRKPTKEEFTKVWIDLINQIERLKAEQ